MSLAPLRSLAITSFWQQWKDSSEIVSLRALNRRRAIQELLFETLPTRCARTRMAAYLVLMQEINDMDRYRNEYLSGVGTFLQKYGAEVLVAGSDAEPAEGEPPNSTVVIRFADAQAAWGFLNDPGYQPLKEIRLATYRCPRQPLLCRFSNQARSLPPSRPRLRRRRRLVRPDR
jgi:uncharacterized protein (DUF1330 family)